MRLKKLVVAIMRVIAARPGKIVEIDFLAGPERLAALDLAALD